MDLLGQVGERLGEPTDELAGVGELLDKIETKLDDVEIENDSVLDALDDKM